MDRDLWQTLLDDLKKAREAPGSETIYALADAWSAYIVDKDTRIQELEAALRDLLSYQTSAPITIIDHAYAALQGGQGDE